jgi:O-antigen/teichoic acid export membrane protein
MVLKKSIVQNFSSQFFSVIIGLVISIISAKVLKAEGRGELSMYNNGLGIVSAWVGLSLASAVVYFLGSRKISENKIIYSSFIYNLLSSIILFVFLVYIGNTDYSSKVFTKNINGVEWALMFSINYFVIQSNSILTSVLQVNKGFGMISKVNIILNISNLILYIIILNYENYNGLHFIIFGSLMLNIVVMFFYLYKIGLKKISKFSVLNKNEFKLIISFVLIVYLSNSIQILNYKLDLWFVKNYHGEAESGVYSLAANLSQMLWILPNAIAAVLFTFLSKSNDIKEKIELTILYSKVTLILIVPISFCFYFFLKYMIPIFYGDEFLSSIDMIFYLLFGTVPFVITTVIASFYASCNKLLVNFYTSLIGLLLAFFFYFILIKKFGGIGASLTSVISYVSSTVFITLHFFKTNHIAYSKIFITKSDIEIFKKNFRWKNY